METFPQIVLVAMVTGDGIAEEVADNWRAKGYTVKVYDRVARAAGLASPIQVVVLTGRPVS